MKTKEKYTFKDFTMANLRGVGQVFFQENALCGLVILVGIFYGSYLENSLHIAVAALFALIVSTATGIIFNYKQEDVLKGLYGYNGILVGIALASFLKESPFLWAFIFLGSICSSAFFHGMKLALLKFNISALTFPFVFISWIFIFFASFVFIDHSEVSVPREVINNYELFTAGFLKSISQVFLINNSDAGAFFLFGLGLSSMRAFSMAIFGSLVALGLSLLIGINQNEIAQGLFGYSSVLVAIAIGSVFFKPSFKVWIYALFGIGLSLLIQIIMIFISKKFDLPIFTAPFIFAVWIVLLIRFLIGFFRKSLEK